MEQLIVAVALIIILHYIFNFLREDNKNLWEERFQKLGQEIRANFFGQHIAVAIVTKALRKHLTSEQPEKALVLVFSGSLGLGKTFLADSILGHHFKQWFGYHSVRSYLGPRHFNDEMASTPVIDTVRRAQRSLFLFDEIGMMRPEILSELTFLMDRTTCYNGVDFRKATFIFVTNAGGEVINKITVQKRDTVLAVDRRFLGLQDYRSAVEQAIYNEKSGLQWTPLISKKLYDVLVPFLPMERTHISRCIENELDKMAPKYSTGISIKKVMANMSWFPDPGDGLFSTEGAKHIKARILDEIVEHEYDHQGE